MQTMTSRRDLLKAALGTAAIMATPDSLAGALSPAIEKAAPGDLAASAFRQLRLGEVRPAGWLLRQLRIQADGMGGHLDEFWPDVGPNSGWLGGTGESWERGPYFVDGLLPLAWMLDDDVLKAKAMRFVEWTLTHQSPDGMIGPASNDDWWPRMVMLKVLMQYHGATSDPRVLPVMTRYFHHQLQTLPSRPLRDWGKYRWQDEALVVAWLYEKTADDKLLALANLLQQQGFDWVANYANFKFTGPTSRAVLSKTAIGGNKDEGMQTHGVNNGMGLKTAAVRYRFNRSEEEHANFAQGIATLDRYHGMPNGIFSCDEHLAGLDPNHGTELCTVVETMFSMEVALATFGDPKIADRIEKIAFNALPGTFTDDMWAHQYDQQPNQVQSSLNSKPWTTNGPESNLYGLEPNFGCCTANFHQGWPKFTASLWMSTHDGGLVATMYAPCEVKTKLQGVNLHLREETDYPFRGTIRITVSPEKTLRFPMLLRIPAWAKTAAVHVNGTLTEATAAPGTFMRLERSWAAGDNVEIRFPLEPTISRSFQRSVVVERGPLVFSLSPGESWVKLRDRGLTADWQVFPTRPWNYALAVDEVSGAKLKVVERPVPARPFAAEAAAVAIEIRGRRLPSWRSEDGVADPLPPSPVTSAETEEVLALVPYAGAKLRVTAFPQLAPDPKQSSGTS